MADWGGKGGVGKLAGEEPSHGFFFFFNKNFGFYSLSSGSSLEVLSRFFFLR